MKKVIVLAFGIAMLASCNKEYTCECSTKDGNGNVLQSASTTMKGKKKDMEAACSGKSSSSGVGTTYTSECKLLNK